MLHWGVSKLSAGEWLVSFYYFRLQNNMHGCRRTEILINVSALLLNINLSIMKVPPQEMLPERSKLVSGACQTYFKEMYSRDGWFQVIWLKNH